MGWQYTSRTL